MLRKINRGVFICKKRKKFYLKYDKLYYENYQTIQKEMNTNKLPTKDE